MRRFRIATQIVSCLVVMMALQLSFLTPVANAAPGGTINTELISINLGKSSTGNYVYGNIVIVEWINGISTVPDALPKLFLRSTDGAVESEMFVSGNGTNTYYFDKYIDGLPTDKTYYIRAVLNNGSSMLVGQIGSRNLGKISDRVTVEYGSYGGQFALTLTKAQGTINTELTSINLGKSSTGNYVYGNIVIVEWVNGISTVPDALPKLFLRSTDGTVETEMFVSGNGTNTYYFDKYIDELPRDKTYYIRAALTNGSSMLVGQIGSRNLGKISDRVTVEYGSFEGKFALTIKTVQGTINTELISINLGKNTTGNYISGNIVIVEWVDGVSTVPYVLPKLFLRSIDGTVETEMFVSGNGTNTYYFDKYIDELPRDKTYYIRAVLNNGSSMLVGQVGSGNLGNISNTVAVEYGSFEGKFALTIKTVQGTINTELKNINAGKSITGNYIYGNMVIVEWVNGISMVPDVLPKLFLRSTDGAVETEMFVLGNGTNTYYFDKYIDGLPTNKTYYIRAVLNNGSSMLVGQIGSGSLYVENVTINYGNLEGKFALSYKVATFTLSVSANRYSGTTSDKYDFTAATNVAVSKVELTFNGNSTVYQMNSTNKKSWTLNGNTLNAGTRIVTIKAYGTDGTTFTKTLTLTVTATVNNINTGGSTSSNNGVSTTPQPYIRDVTGEVNRALIPVFLPAQEMAKFFDVFYPAYESLRYTMFVQLVWPGGPWNIKDSAIWKNTIGTEFPGYGVIVSYDGMLMTPEDLGNFTYGFLGATFGFSYETLIYGSVAAAALVGSLNSPEGRSNEVEDWNYIQLGYSYYK